MNYLRDIAQGVDILLPERTISFASRLDIPEDKILDKGQIGRVIDMLSTLHLRYLIDGMQNDTLPPARRKLQKFILEKAENRLEEIEN